MSYAAKTKHDNDVTDCTSVVYVENHMELRGGSDRVLTKMKTRLENWTTEHTDAVYAKNENEQPRPIKSGSVWDEIGQDNDVTDHISLV